jgi:hypothetical protein
MMGLLVLAAAAPAAAQSHPRWQVEASLDQTGSHSMYAVIADRPTGGYEVSQTESVGWSVAATRLASIAPHTSLRFGLSLANKGYDERSVVLIGAPRTPGLPAYFTDEATNRRRIDVVYLGAPLALGYNLVNPRRGLKPFIEAGVVPELLVRQEKGALDFDLSGTGLSYLVNLGVKYNLGDGRAVVLAPEARIAAWEYSTGAPGERQYRPTSVGIKLGLQF